MGQAEPEVSCNQTMFKYQISPQELEAARQQVLKVLGKQPVIFMEQSLATGQVELLVIITSLTPSQKNELQELQQDGVMVQRIAESKFAVNQVSFGEP